MTERELELRAQRRRAVLRHVEEVSGNVAATCRYERSSTPDDARSARRNAVFRAWRWLTVGVEHPVQSREQLLPNTGHRGSTPPVTRPRFTLELTPG